MVSAEEFRWALKVLKSRYGRWLPEHMRGDPFSVLVGAILSHRTRDEKTDEAHRALLKRYPTPQALANAPLHEIKRLIKPVGFYRVKARRLKETARILLEKYGGRVPKGREELKSLPGVGDKTADIVLSIAFGLPEIAVDTHVETVAKRLGVAGPGDGYAEVKRKLENLTPPEKRRVLNQLFVLLGKEFCRNPKPACQQCPIKRVCGYYYARKGF